MFKILTLNNISVAGLERFPRERYEVASEMSNPDAILLRSYNMHDMDLPDSLKAVARAGAGVNNIPIAKMNERGIPVFNAPGANANAVKELVIAGMLMACRNIKPAKKFVRALEGDNAALHKKVESGKKQFVGFELPNKTLGVIGLGAIGIQVANAAVALGMKVIGYDPQITVQSAWKLSSEVEQAMSVEHLLGQSDFVTFHVPLVDATKDLINAERIKGMKDNAVVLNFAREGIVNNQAMVNALDEGKLYAYVCDFPATELQDNPNVICLPHLGASTIEAEQNCAVMVAEQMKAYLETGTIKNSVNFPEIKMPMETDYRVAIVNKNVPNMLGQMSTTFANSGLNIVDMLNKSRGEIAYTLVDVDSPVTDECLANIKAIDGVLSVRLISRN